ncbi:Protein CHLORORESPIRATORY REDUCTION 6 chloroplastic, partial [Bienertia sinuspersici]
GFRFEVCFNRYYQPIRKDGAVLVKFVADIAKKAELCPIGVVNWRTGKFIIPDYKIFNDALLKHVDKHCRQWKFELKARYFNPTVRTRQQIENDNPGGIVRGTWLELVKYWYSGQSKKYATMVEKHELCLVIFIQMAPQALPIQEMNFRRWNMEESQKLVGYGFGVKRSDVMRVHALLRKKGIASEMNNDNNELKVKFARHKKETASLMMRLSSSVSDLLTAVQGGLVSPETLAATNSALRTITA